MTTPNIRLRLAPALPISVTGTDGITAELSANSMTIGQDWSDFAPVPADDAANFDVLTRDPVSGVYRRTTVADIASLITPELVQFATTAEAAAGVDIAVVMNPARTFEAVDARLPNTAVGRAVLNAVNAESARAAIGASIGTDVQAYDADLSAIAALSGTNTIYYRSGAGAWSPVAIGSNLTFSGGTLAATASASVLRGHISGMTLANNATDIVNDIDFLSGECASDTSPFALLSLASTLTKRLDAAWAVGPGSGGLDTGTIADGTYHCFVIQRSDTSVTDALFSLSATAPTMPANYDRKRRVGSIVRASGAIRRFIQTGDRFVYAEGPPALDVNLVGVTIGTAAVTRTVSVPTGISVIAEVLTRIGNNASPEAIILTDLEGPDVAPDLVQRYSISVGAGSTAAIGLPILCRTNTSAQIRTRMVVGDTNSALRMSVQGWYDGRGR